MNERSSVDTPCHRGVSLILVTGTLCPLLDSAVVTIVVLILLHWFNGAASFVYLKERDNFGSTLSDTRPGCLFSLCCAWYGPQNPSDRGSVGLPGLFMNDFARIDVVSAVNVTLLLSIQHLANSEHTTDEHCDKHRDQMGHPQEKTRAILAN